MDTVGSVGLEIKVLEDQLISEVKSSVKEASIAAQKEISSVASGIKNTIKRIGVGISVVALTKFGKECTKLGSDLSEVQNVVDVVYGEMSDAVNNFAQSAKASFGLSETAAKQYMGTFGSMSKAFGFSVSDAYKQSEALTGLAGDMASFYNKTTDETFNALKSVYSGESEVLKQYGIIMNETTLNEYAMSQGINKTVKQMSEQEKVALRLSFVQNKLSDAAGDFSRTSGGWANQIRLLTLNFEQFKATIGQALINVLTPLIQWLNKLFDWINSCAEAIKEFTDFLPWVEDSGSGGVASDMSSAASSSKNLNKNLKSAGGAAKTLKRTLASFDKLNILTNPSTGGGGAGGSISGGSISGGNTSSLSSSLGKSDGKNGFSTHISEAKVALNEFIDYCTWCADEAEKAFGEFTDYCTWLIDEGGWLDTFENLGYQILHPFEKTTNEAIEAARRVQERYERTYAAIGEGAAYAGNQIATSCRTVNAETEGTAENAQDSANRASQTIKNIADGVSQGIASDMNSVQSSVQSAVKMSLDLIGSGGSQATDSVSLAIDGMKAAAVTGAEAIGESFEELPSDTRRIVRTIIDESIIKELRDSVIKVNNATTYVAAGINNSFKSELSKLPQETTAIGESTSQNLVNSIQNGVNTKKDIVAKEVSSISSDIKNCFKDGAKGSKYNDLKSSGNYIVEGIAKGISDKKTELGKTMRKLAEDSLKEFNKAAKIKSPSQVFAVSGSYIVEGLNKGIEDNANSTKTVVNDWFSSFKNANTPQLGFINKGDRNTSRSDVSESVTSGMMRLLPQLMAMMNSSARNTKGNNSTSGLPPIHLYIDGREIHDVVFEYEDRDNSRSGGRT